eukprot:scaffold1446_cov127-Isochrysis_galbana.AAC.3
MGACLRAPPSLAPALVPKSAPGRARRAPRHRRRAAPNVTAATAAARRSDAPPSGIAEEDASGVSPPGSADTATSGETKSSSPSCESSAGLPTPSSVKER